MKLRKWGVNCKQQFGSILIGKKMVHTFGQGNKTFLCLIWGGPMGIELWTLTVAGFLYLATQDKELFLHAEATTEAAYCV